MSRSDQFSDEHLNAFIDGELEEAEREYLLDLLRRDAKLNARVCDLQKVRELVQHAYRNPPRPPRRSPCGGRRGVSRFTAGLAASVMLGLGLAIGWGLHDTHPPRATLLDIAQSMQLPEASTGQDGVWRVMLHVTTDDAYRLKTVLDEAEQLLRTRAGGRGVVVDILANGHGLNLLRTDTSPFAERIRELQARYRSSLTFKACQNAINRLEREKHIDVRLLPEAQVVPTAIGEVIRRQREGWAYVQI